jgi:hypothetical protein
MTRARDAGGASALMLLVVVAATLISVAAQSPAPAGGPAPRIVHTDPTAYRPLTAVHGGAGNMSFTACSG